ncbi:hypothetical protein ACIP5U_39525 [Streptomyces sp. NPDC088788]|uniref:hypothetical protein n=1 Tax=Streptomyces sp. NPDC088788 TaxID=3365898 RepID=UPI0037F315B7
MTRDDIPLDAMAEVLEFQRGLWSTEGLHPSPVLRSEGGEHLGISLTSADWHVRLTVELHRSGWAQLFFSSPTHTAEEPRRIRSVEAWTALLDEAAARASRLRLLPARLLARTCTTGWLDWIHGELWLLPDALIRVRSGLMDSVVNSASGSGVSARDPYQVIPFDVESIRSAHRTNKVLPLAELSSARLHGGLTTSGMTATMRDGTHHKLLWLSTEPAGRLLRDRLLPVLGQRLTH